MKSIAGSLKYNTTKFRSRRIILALSLILISVKVMAEDAPNPTAVVSVAEKTNNGTEKEKQDLNPYKPTYFMFQWGTHDPRDNQQLYAKFQFNIKQNIWNGLYFAYTYRALWSITEQSAPFKDNSHNPEIFVANIIEDFWIMTVVLKRRRLFSNAPERPIGIGKIKVVPYILFYIKLKLRIKLPIIPRVMCSPLKDEIGGLIRV